MVGILAVGTLAAGCQTTPSVTVPIAQTITSKALQAYNWQLVDAKNNNGAKVTQLFYNPEKPLNFMTANDDNRVALMNTCNNMSAGYSVANGNVQLGNRRNTRIACPEPQTSFDTAATVQGK